MEGRTTSAGTGLAGVTFVVFDLETTGTAPDHCAITEVGAVKYRGGECLGTLATFVDPGEPVPPLVTRLTGIHDAMVAGAPTVNRVLPSLVEFVGDAVLVGHNVSFDVSFLAAACTAAGREPLPNPAVDTLALARRLLAGEVPDMKLRTLAGYLRTARVPRHRALPDALATADVFHALLERVATFGVSTLESLLDFPERVPVAAVR